MTRLYLRFARSGFRRYAAYPAATWAGAFTNTVFGFIQAYILLALYEQRDEIGGYDAVDTVTYVWLAQAMIAAVQVFGWADLARRIRTGDVATDLVRPVHPLRVGLAFDLGRALYHVTFRGIPPFLVGAIAFDVEAPGSPLVLLAFGVSLVLAVCVSYAFRALYNLAAFWLLDDRGPRILGVTVALFFSGFIVPVHFFPEPLRLVATATPFPAMIQTPIDVFVGKLEGVEVVAGLALQFAWAGALFALAHAVFAGGTRKLVVQGG